METAIKNTLEYCVGKDCKIICEYEYPDPHDYVSYVARRTLPDGKGRYEIISVFKNSDKNETYKEQAQNFIENENSLSPSLLRYNEKNAYNLINFSTPFIPGVTLATLVTELKNHGKLLSLFSIARLGLGIAHSLKCLHDQNHIHRALSPEKIIIDINFQPHLLGTEIASARIQTSNSYGVLAFSAPGNSEGEYSSETDMYSYGSILFFMCTGCQPYDDITGKSDASEIQAKINNYDYDQRFNGEEFFTRKNESKVKKIIGLCWESNSSKRLTAKKAVSSFSKFEGAFKGNEEKMTKFCEYVNKIVKQEPKKVPKHLLRDDFMEKDCPSGFSFDQCESENVLEALKFGFAKTGTNDNMEKIMNEISKEKEFGALISHPNYEKLKFSKVIKKIIQEP